MNECIGDNNAGGPKRAGRRPLEKTVPSVKYFSRLPFR